MYSRKENNLYRLMVLINLILLISLLSSLTSQDIKREVNPEPKPVVKTN